LDLIPAGGVDAATRLVLANAVYFRGAWRQPFPAKQTEDALFVTAEGGKVRVPLMRDRRREDVPYAAFTGAGDPFPTPLTVPADGSLVAPVYPEADGFQVVELPYQGGDLAMVLLLPRAPEGLGRLERLLTADRLTQWLAGLVRRDVDTAMPRFQQRSRLDLGASLRALGVTRAFVDPTTGAGAQFGRIQGPVGPTQQLFVGAVFHQAFVEVNEQGTEAAAATAVTMAPSAAVPKRVELVPFRPVFRADHPFLFLIRDTKSGAILFVGRVVDPAGDSH
jgi:serine protease inhibitor